MPPTLARPATTRTSSFATISGSSPAPARICGGDVGLPARRLDQQPCRPGPARRAPRRRPGAARRGRRRRRRARSWARARGPRRASPPPRRSARRARWRRPRRRARAAASAGPPTGRRRTPRPPTASRLSRAYPTATGSTSAACSSTSGRRVARASPSAPEPQHRSTTIGSTTAATARQAGERLLDEQLRPRPGHEHTRADPHPDPAERRPAQQVLERLAGDPAGHQRLERRRVAGGRLQEQRGLVLGVHAPRRAQPRDQLVERRRRHAPDATSRRRRWSPSGRVAQSSGSINRSPSRSV